MTTVVERDLDKEYTEYCLSVIASTEKHRFVCVANNETKFHVNRGVNLDEIVDTSKLLYAFGLNNKIDIMFRQGTLQVHYGEHVAWVVLDGHLKNIATIIKNIETDLFRVLDDNDKKRVFDAYCAKNQITTK